MRRTTSGHRLPLSTASEVQGECRGELAWPLLSRSLHSYSQLHDCEYKDNKKFPDFPTFKKLISNLFQMLKRKLPADGTVPEPVVGRFLSLPKESIRFLTSISQILVIFEPDSYLDAKNPQNRYCTIVPLYHLEKRFLYLKMSYIDLYILLYIL